MFGNKEAVNLMQLKEGYTLKTQGSLWTIKEVVDYDWGVDGKSTEYKLSSSQGDIAYLEVERYEGAYEIAFSEPATFTKMTLEEAITSKSIVYNGVLFELEEYYQGAASNQTLRTSWENVQNHIFYDENEAILSIETFSGKDPEAFYGHEIREKDLKNIVSNA